MCRNDDLDSFRFWVLFTSMMVVVLGIVALLLIAIPAADAADIQLSVEDPQPAGEYPLNVRVDVSIDRPGYYSWQASLARPLSMATVGSWYTAATGSHSTIVYEYRQIYAVTGDAFISRFGLRLQDHLWQNGLLTARLLRMENGTWVEAASETQRVPTGHKHNIRLASTTSYPWMDDPGAPQVGFSLCVYTATRYQVIWPASFGGRMVSVEAWRRLQAAVSQEAATMPMTGLPLACTAVSQVRWDAKEYQYRCYHGGSVVTDAAGKPLIGRYPALLTYGRFALSVTGGNTVKRRYVDLGAIREIAVTDQAYYSNTHPWTPGTATLPTAWWSAEKSCRWIAAQNAGHEAFGYIGGRPAVVCY